MDFVVHAVMVELGPGNLLVGKKTKTKTRFEKRRRSLTPSARSLHNHYVLSPHRANGAHPLNAFT